MPVLPSEALDRSGRRSAPAAVRRAEIIEAALSCFSERGYHATTMDHLVAASGLSKGSLYWHFESKEDIFLALFDHLAQEIFGRVDEATQQGGVDVVSLLRREFTLFLERFSAERRLVLAWAEFLSHPRGRERMAASYRQLRVKFAELIQLGIDRCELRPLAPLSAATAITAMIEGLLLQAAVDPEFDAASHEAVVWEILERGVRAR